MIPAPVPDDELQRLRELYSLELLDTPYEKEFDDIVRIASKICNTPISTITLIDSDRQWFKAKIGTEDNNDPRSITFCGHAIMDDKLMVVPNAIDDERFFDNPLVTGDPPNIRYYAGMPLVTQSGYKIGSLCVIDRVPRTLDPEQLQTLEALATQVMKLIELRVKNKQLQELTDVKNRIISIIGHDVRNPLSGIKGTLELKQMGLIQPEEEGSMLDRLSGQVDTTMDMLTNLAEWGKLDFMPSKSHIQALPISNIADSCLDELALNADAKGNVIKNETGNIFYSAIDKNSLHFILRNLLTNANKFTERGVITVTNTANTITVGDTGTGMSAVQIAGLINDGVHATTNGTKNEAGTGLGLMLVKDFLRKVNGRLSIESEPGKGARVTVVFK